MAQRTAAAESAWQSSPTRFGPTESNITEPLPGLGGPLVSTGTPTGGIVPEYVTSTLVDLDHVAKQQLGVVVPGAGADDVAVHHACLVLVNAADLRNVQRALGDRRQRSPLEHAGSRGNLHAVTDYRHRLAEEVSRQPQEVLVIAQVFRRSAAAEKQADVPGRIDVAETPCRTASRG